MPMQAYKSLHVPEEKEKSTEPSSYFSTEEETSIKDVLTLTSQVCEVSICGISLVTENNEWTTFFKGIDTAKIHEKNSFFNYLRQFKCDLAITDAITDPRFNNDTIVTGDLQVRFFKNSCLFDAEENLIGFLFLLDYQTVNLSPEKLSCLSILHKQLLSLVKKITANQTITASNAIRSDIISRR